MNETPDISQRARLVPASPIRALAPIAASVAAQGTRVYHVNIGQPDLSAPQAILDAFKPPADGVIPYAPSSGMPQTIEAWCAYYATLDLSVDPADVLITTGGGEAIGFAMLAVTDPEDEVLIFDPTYASYLGFAAAGNITLVPVPKPPPSYHLPPEEEIERFITPRTRAIVIINPDNPAGTVYTREEIELVLTIARRHGLFVIGDETYRELVFDGREHVSVLEYEDMAQSVILVDSISKRFSATGLRVGALVSKNHDVTAAALRMAMARLSGPTVDQLASVPLLRNPTEYTTWLCGEYQRRRDATYTALQAIPGAIVAKPEGAFYVMVGLPVADANDFARWLLTDFRQDGETVMVAPGPGFYVTPGLGTSEIRIAYVLAEDKLRRAVELLGEALEQYPGTV